MDYTERGLISRIRYSDNEEIHCDYLGERWLTQGRSRDGKVGWRCEPNGRLLAENQNDQTVGYEYDSAGRWSGTTYPGGEKVRFTYDGEERITEIVDWQKGRHLFTYSSDDRRSERRCPNGLRELAEYSEAGTLVAVQVFAPNDTGSALFATRYRYDDEERVASITDSTFGSRDYAYDSIGQVRSVKGSRRQVNEGFVYDPAGNWKTKNGEMVKCNECNQVVAQGGNRFSYDVRGNLVAASGPQGQWRYTYDLRDLLVLAEGPSGCRVEFGYDVMGRRLWKRSATRSVQYVWGGHLLLREIDREGPRTSIRDYLYRPGSFTPLALCVDGHVYCYHTDRLGTPQRLTDQHGQIVWLADYAVFGEARIEMELIRNDLRFPGQQFDPETGLHYNRYRYYAPALGRYLTRDPLGFSAGAHLYSYVHNRTTHFIDPLGLAPNQPPKASPGNGVKLTDAYTATDVLVKSGEPYTPQQAMKLLQQDPNRIFPFPFTGPEGQKNITIKAGGKYHLKPTGTEVMAGDLHAENVTARSFTLVVDSDGYIVPKGSTITFSTSLDSAGNLILQHNGQLALSGSGMLAGFANGSLINADAVGGSMAWHVQAMNLANRLHSSGN